MGSTAGSAGFLKPLARARILSCFALHACFAAHREVLHTCSAAHKEVYRRVYGLSQDAAQNTR